MSAPLLQFLMHYVYVSKEGSQVVGSCLVNPEDFSNYGVLEVLREQDKFLKFITAEDITISQLGTAVTGDIFTPENPLRVEIKGKLHKLKYAVANQSVEVQIEGAGTPLLGLNLVSPLNELFNFFQRDDVSKAFCLGKVTKEACLKALDYFVVYAYEMNVARDAMPKSKTWNSYRSSSATVVLFYCPKDDLGVLGGRLLHELTHALRYSLSIVQGKRQTDTPPKASIPSVEGKYKMTSERIHSGYIAEHELRGGVTLYLNGLIKENEVVKDVSVPVACTIIKKLEPFVEYGEDSTTVWDVLIVKDGESEKKILHKGERVTRS